MAFTFAPYLLFPGTARDALEFYAGVFGGTAEYTTYGEYGRPELDIADKVMHATFRAPGITIYAADDNDTGDRSGTPAVGVSLALMTPEPEDARRWFAALAEGGEVVQDLSLQAWGDWYGEVRDRFGVAWMFDFVETAA